MRQAKQVQHRAGKLHLVLGHMQVPGLEELADWDSDGRAEVEEGGVGITEGGVSRGTERRCLVFLLRQGQLRLSKITRRSIAHRLLAKVVPVLATQGRRVNTF